MRTKLLVRIPQNTRKSKYKQNMNYLGVIDWQKFIVGITYTPKGQTVPQTLVVDVVLAASLVVVDACYIRF